MASRPLRYQRTDDVFVVSNRCFQNQELIPTDPVSTGRIVGALGRYSDIYNIELFAYSFLPHGFWMVLRSNEAERQNFMRDFQAWLALWVNRKNEREGSLFHQRYDDEAILDVAKLIETCVDVVVAPVREGFAESLDEYTGATSWQWLQTGTNPVGDWINRYKLRSLRRSNPDLPEDEVAESFEVRLYAPPVDSFVYKDSVSEKEAIESVKKGVSRRIDDILEWQNEAGEEVVLEKRSKPRPSPKEEPSLVEPMGPPKYRYDWLCRVASEELRKKYRDLRKQRVRADYTRAIRLWQRGKDEFCQCCGGKSEEKEASNKAEDGQLAADGGELVADEPGEDGSGETESKETCGCGNDVDFPRSTIAPGCTKAQRPLVPRRPIGPKGGPRSAA